MTNLNPHPHLSFHISVVTFMCPGGHKGMCEGSLQGPGNFKTFHDLHLVVPPSRLGWERYFKTFCDYFPHPPPHPAHHDGMLFHDLSRLSIKSVCTNPQPLPYEHTRSQSQTPHHVNSPCCICYNKKFKKFICRMLYISICWVARDILLGQLEVYFFKFIETYSLNFQYF